MAASLISAPLLEKVEAVVVVLPVEAGLGKKGGDFTAAQWGNAAEYSDVSQLDGVDTSAAEMVQRHFV